MNGRNFSLQPFSPISPRLDITMSGSIIRRAHKLAIRYELSGQLGKLVIPAPASTPARRHGLWQATCFEFFLGVKQARRYWEFNLSPAGDWNVYRFAAYRQGVKEEMAFTSLPVSLRPEPDSVRLALEVDLGSIIPADQPLEVGIAAVIQLAGGGLTYWALTHGGLQPDFHRRDSFIVALSA
ncbi:MAG: DOMON-like domain-containing protein [Desulfobaccales bacterium]